MRCVYCGAEMSPWDKKCPACREVDPRDRTEVNPHKKKMIKKYATIIAVAAFLLYLVIYYSGQEIVYQKYSKLAEQHMSVEQYYKALACYEHILEKYPSCVRAQDGLTDTLLTMYDEGKIDSKDEGYQYFLKYGDYMHADNRDKLWHTLVYYYGE